MTLLPIQPRAAQMTRQAEESDFGVKAGIGFISISRYLILSPEIKISNGIGNIHSRDANLNSPTHR